MHLSIDAEYASGGTRSGEQLLLRLLREVRRSTRRVKGVRRVELYYGGEPALAHAGQGDDRNRLVLRRRLAVASLIALWCALLAAMLGRYAWPFDLFAHFRVQYTLLFLIVAILLFALRAPLLAVVAIAGAVVGAIPDRQLHGRADRASRGELGEVPGRLVQHLVSQPRLRGHRALSRADAGRRHRDRRARSRRRRAADRPLSCGPIRIRSTPDCATARSCSRVGRSFRRNPLPLAESPGVRAARVTLDWQGTPVTVLGVHLHWPLGPRSSRLRNAELASIASFAAAHQEPLIVAGDFNATPWSQHFRAALERSGLQRLRSRPRPRAVMAVAIPAARHPHRSLLGVAPLAQRRRAARTVARLGSSAADRGSGVGAAVTGRPKAA